MKRYVEVLKALFKFNALLVAPRSDIVVGI